MAIDYGGREVDDALVAYQRYLEQRAALDRVVKANRERARLAELALVDGRPVGFTGAAQSCVPMLNVPTMKSTRSSTPCRSASSRA